jgi:hypothetical protein
VTAAPQFVDPGQVNIDPYSRLAHHRGIANDDGMTVNAALDTFAGPRLKVLQAP